MDKIAFSGNTDTGFLKTIAFITMLADHVGYLFFPEQIFWRIIGRIAFPLFAYCSVLGFFYTKNIRKYFIRLFVFSFLSQIPYTLCFYPSDIKSFPEYFHLNIGFTLILGLMAIFGLDRKRYLLTAAAVALSFFQPVEYGFYGVYLMIAVFVFSSFDKSTFFAALAICLVSPAFSVFLGEDLDPQFFAVFSLVFIFIKTDSKIRIPRWLNYSFYPLHIAILYFIKLFI